MKFSMPMPCPLRAADSGHPCITEMRQLSGDLAAEGHFIAAAGVLYILTFVHVGDSAFLSQALIHYVNDQRKKGLLPDRPHDAIPRIKETIQNLYKHPEDIWREPTLAGLWILLGDLSQGRTALFTTFLRALAKEREVVWKGNVSNN